MSAAEVTRDEHPAVPAGPWLLVVGMHRSGTSALCGALGALGFSTPQQSDLVQWAESNTEHWESAALTAFDDELLAAMGGSWEAPPDLAPDWEVGTSAPGLVAAAAAARTAFPNQGPVAWKDPRLCLLLPYWRRVLPGPLAAVLIWRSPLAVAESLRKRDGMHLADGIALWERYNRAAVRDLAGVDTYVCNYEALVDDPASGVAAMAEWFKARPQFADHATGWNEAAATAAIGGSPGRGSVEETELLLPSQQELIARLTELDGGRVPLVPPQLTTESGWTTALLAARQGSRTREFQIEIANKQRQLDQMRRSVSWRVTRPLRRGIAAFGSLRAKTHRN